MATIKDTLNDILRIQSELEILDFNDLFVKEELFNLTSILYFQLSAHATLDQYKYLFRQEPLSNEAKDYFNLCQKDDVLEEYIRVFNISYLFLVWNIIEMYIDRLFLKLNISENNIEEKFKKILTSKHLLESKQQSLLHCFNTIRLTRNALHQGGKYRYPNKKTYKFKGVEYIFEKDKEVKALRIIDIIDEFIQMVKSLNA